MIKHNAYDAMYENDWDKRPSVSLYGSAPFEDIMRFARFMSSQLGFRLRVTFRHPGVIDFQRVP